MITRNQKFKVIDQLTWLINFIWSIYWIDEFRVDQLKQLGHSVDKVEFIVMGGTFMALPDDYKDYFIRFKYLFIINLKVIKSKMGEGE